MATQGAWTLFNIAKPKLTNGLFDLDGNVFKVSFHTSAQAIDATFAGASTDCRYSDLTGELATANGYTAGGATLGSVTLTRSTGTVTFDCADPSWTLTNTITMKYAIIRASALTNADLLCFCDLDTGGGSVSPIAGALNLVMNASGIFTYA